MRVISGTVAVLASSLVLCGAALAQDAEPSKYFAHIGLNRSVSSTVRGSLSDTGVAAGAGLIVRNSIVRDAGAQTSVDLDFLRLNGNGDRLDTAGLTYAVRIPYGSGNDDTKPYYGLGLGWFRSEARSGVPDSTDRSTATARATNFGAKFLFGANVGGKAFAEASYIVSGDLASTNANSVNFTVGLRF